MRVGGTHRFGLRAGRDFQSGVSPVPRQPPHSKTLARYFPSARSSKLFSCGPNKSFNASACAADVIFFHDFWSALIIFSSFVFAARSAT